MVAYYNEFDPKAAAWLRSLIAAGHIAPGDVDERSIKDVQPHELAGYTQCHFFAGIGVWSYALRRAGWPDDRPVWTGSCPCQPFSAAGKGEGLDDPRHLWPDWFRLIRERRPLVVFGEQVAGPDGIAWLDLAQADMEEDSYTVGTVVTCSAGFGGPDIRQRIYWVADPDEGQRGSGRSTPRPAGGAHAESAGRGSAGRLADPHGERLEGLGLQLLERGPQSAIPQIAWRGEAGGVGDSRSEGLPERERRARVPSGACGADEGEALERGSIRPGRLADTDGGIEGDRGIQRGWQHRLEPQNRGARDGGVGPGPLNGFWRAADWLFCTDGKWRPVEPSTFPLVNGAPARLVRVRGYGNGLNAEVAQEFVGAYLDVKETSFPPPSTDHGTC